MASTVQDKQKFAVALVRLLFLNKSRRVPLIDVWLNHVMGTIERGRRTRDGKSFLHVLMQFIQHIMHSPINVRFVENNLILLQYEQVSVNISRMTEEERKVIDYICTNWKEFFGEKAQLLSGTGAVVYKNFFYNNLFEACFPRQEIVQRLLAMILRACCHGDAPGVIDRTYHRARLLVRKIIWSMRMRHIVTTFRQMKPFFEVLAVSPHVLAYVWDVETDMVPPSTLPGKRYV